MRFFSLVSSPAMIFPTLAEMEGRVHVTTVPDVGTTTTLGKVFGQFGQMDILTKLFTKATLFCTIRDTIWWAKKLRRENTVEDGWDKFCAVKTVANVANSLRRGFKPGMRRRALMELIGMEGLHYAVPTAFLGLNWKNEIFINDPLLILSSQTGKGIWNLLQLVL
jgi:hypothetical protein